MCSATLYSPPHPQPSPLCRWHLPRLSGFGGGSGRAWEEGSLPPLPLAVAPRLARAPSGSQEPNHSSQSRVGEPRMTPFLPHPLPGQVDDPPDGATPSRTWRAPTFRPVLPPVPCPSGTLQLGKVSQLRFFCAYFKSHININDKC